MADVGVRKPAGFAPQVLSLYGIQHAVRNSG
jgi:hypothetical protein